MTSTTANRIGINLVLNIARTHNRKIGSYKEHFLNDRFNYTVRLSNGRIEIPRTMAADQEVQPLPISPERIKFVLDSFMPI